MGREGHNFWVTFVRCTPNPWQATSGGLISLYGPDKCRHDPSKRMQPSYRAHAVRCSDVNDRTASFVTAKKQNCRWDRCPNDPLGIAMITWLCTSHSTFFLLCFSSRNTNSHNFCGCTTADMYRRWSKPLFVSAQAKYTATTNRKQHSWENGGNTETRSLPHSVPAISQKKLHTLPQHAVQRG